MGGLPLLFGHRTLGPFHAGRDRTLLMKFEQADRL